MAAILFPVFGRARENARRSSCQSNLKQIGLGFGQYTQDYDERYPLAYYTTVADGAWPTLLQPYVKSRQLFKCPSETMDVASSYLLNNAFHQRPLAEIQTPATTVVSVEGVFGYGGPWSVNSTSNNFGLNADYTLWTDTGRFNDPTKKLPRHLGTSNALYADGHVKSTKPLDVSNNTAAERVARAEAALPFATAINPPPTSTSQLGGATSWQ